MHALFKTSQYEAGYFFNNQGAEEYYMIENGQLKSFETIDQLIVAINGKIKAHLTNWHNESILALGMLENQQRQAIGLKKYELRKKIRDFKKTIESQENFLFSVGAFKSNAQNLIEKISESSKEQK
jgi:hypothetical protein